MTVEPLLAYLGTFTPIWRLGAPTERLRVKKCLLVMPKYRSKRFRTKSRLDVEMA